MLLHPVQFLIYGTRWMIFSTLVFLLQNKQERGAGAQKGWPKWKKAGSVELMTKPSLAPLNFQQHSYVCTYVCKCGCTMAQGRPKKGNHASLRDRLPFTSCRVNNGKWGIKRVHSSTVQFVPPLPFFLLLLSFFTSVHFSCCSSVCLFDVELALFPIHLNSIRLEEI